MRELLVGLRDRIRVLEEENDVLRSPAFRGNVSDQHHDRRWGCRLGAALVLVLLFALAAHGVGLFHRRQTCDAGRPLVSKNSKNVNSKVQKHISVSSIRMQCLVSGRLTPIAL